MSEKNRENRKISVDRSIGAQPPKTAPKPIELDDVKHESENFDQDPNPLFYDNVIHYRQESAFSQYNLWINLDGFKNLLFLILAISISRLLLENITNYGIKTNHFRWFSVLLNDQSLPIIIAIWALSFTFPLISLLIERLFVFYLDSMGRITVQQAPESMTTLKNITKINGDYDANKNNDNLETKKKKFTHENPFQREMTILKFKSFPNEENFFKLIWSSLLIALMFTPVVINWLFDDLNPYLSSFICLWYCFMFMKLYSYHQVNYWWRTGQVYDGLAKPSLKSQEKMELYQGETLRAWNPTKIILYPQNLIIKDIIKFIFLPTFCYQCNFPYKLYRDYSFIFRCIVEMVLISEVICVLSNQWVIGPLSEKSIDFRDVTIPIFILRWTKLSFGTIFIWLLFFYLIFQSVSNLLAEILQFADRNFYEDWWNSRTISEFWRKWNMPVHRWIKRHVFKPFLLSGMDEFWSTFLIFFFSGLFHEYAVSVPLRKFSVHFILGMSLQTFFDSISRRIRSWNLANAFVWSTLVLGQPLLIIFYHNDVLRQQISS